MKGERRELYERRSFLRTEDPNKDGTHAQSPSISVGDYVWGEIASI